MVREELGIIREIHFGMRDAGRPILWFDVSMIGGGFLAVIEMPDLRDFIREANYYKLEDLKGKPVVVAVDDGVGEFVRFFCE